MHSNTSKRWLMRSNVLRILQRLINAKSFILFVYCIDGKLKASAPTALFTYNFNYREEFENNFLTDEFDKIDLDMALRGQTKVLPLNKNEKLQYIRRASWKMTSKERTFYRVRLVMTLILSSTPFCFMCMDMGVYSVRNNDIANYFRVLTVSGTGEAAKMMRSLQEVFSPLTSDIRERDDRWRNCFVEPNPPDENILWTIILLFVISIFLCRFEVCALALADNFFPDRVRPRALMLYNRILQSRKNILGAMLEEKKKLLADDQIAGREAIIRRGLQSRGFIRVNCSICNEPDLRIADESNTRLCVSCGVYYCIQCFCLRRYCKECNHDMQVIDRVEMYYEDPTDDEESEDELEDNDNVNPEPDLNTKVSAVKISF
uniref:DC_STAMP domain-containing protein n=1 Tax=Angiostrongylus cantonensis TaxID=6313 RepID=A0A158PCW6_ANGCA